MAYGDFKDLARRTAFDRVLRDKAFNIAKIPMYDGYQRGLASMVYKRSGANIKVRLSEKLAEELHKPITRKFKKRTVYSRFKENIWCANLGDMQLKNKFNKGFTFYCVLLIILVNTLGLSL